MNDRRMSRAFDPAVTDTLRRPLLKPVLGVSCLVLSAACQGEVPDPGAADLFSPRPGDGAWRVSAEPIFVVGAEESLPLADVSGAVFFGDGIAIADAMSHELLIVDSAGRLVARHGRKGDGPGEYRLLAGVARHGGGLITWDANHFRVTRLDSAREYVGETKVRPRHGLPKVSLLVGSVGNSVLIETSVMGFPGTGDAGPVEVRQPVAYKMVRLSDGKAVFEGTLPGVEQWAKRDVYDGGGSHGGIPVIFGRDAVSAVAGGYAYLATTDSVAITRYDEAGTAVGVFSYEQPRKSAEGAWVRFVRDSTRAHLESIRPGQIFLGGKNFMESVKERSLRLLEDLPARPTLPSFSAMVGGADGLLWIREYPDPFQDEAAWVGFSETWERRKRIVMPPNLNVLDISEDRVLVHARASRDEHLVEVYEIKR